MRAYVVLTQSVVETWRFPAEVPDGLSLEDLHQWIDENKDELADKAEEEGKFDLQRVGGEADDFETDLYLDDEEKVLLTEDEMLRFDPAI